MELILIVLILFAKKQHILGFTHFTQPQQKEVFFYNPWLESQLFIGGYATGVFGSGFLNFPANQEKILLQVVRNGHVLFEQEYKLFDDLIMVFVPQVKSNHLQKVLP